MQAGHFFKRCPVFYFSLEYELNLGCFSWLCDTNFLSLHLENKMGLSGLCSRPYVPPGDGRLVLRDEDT